MSSDSPLAAALLPWQRAHGRHDLPWQSQRTPYRVWVSEIMLQQTQVATVIGYYPRFLQRFPDVAALAAAPVDEVLHLWAGLGYYSRARNLHRAAQRVVKELGGEFPRDVAALAQLPGIGRSTAGAILALGCGLRAPILDGNVRRVLARYFAVEGPPASSRVTQRLWALSEQCTPSHDAAAYTQAVMDLGATVCTRRQPACGRCPLQAGCVAQRDGRQHELPQPRARAARPQRQVVMLLLRDAAGRVLLQRRGEQGVWAGLWTPPQFENAPAARAGLDGLVGAGIVAPAAATRHAPAADAHARGRHPALVAGHELQVLPVVQHAFTHFDLQITPLLCRCEAAGGRLSEPGSMWYDPAAPARVGLPAPVSALLRQPGTDPG